MGLFLKRNANPRIDLKRLPSLEEEAERLHKLMGSGIQLLQEEIAVLSKLTSQQAKESEEKFFKNVEKHKEDFLYVSKQVLSEKEKVELSEFLEKLKIGNERFPEETVIASAYDTVDRMMDIIGIPDNDRESARDVLLYNYYYGTKMPYEDKLATVYEAAVEMRRTADLAYADTMRPINKSRADLLEATEKLNIEGARAEIAEAFREEGYSEEHIEEFFVPLSDEAYTFLEDLRTLISADLGVQKSDCYAIMTKKDPYTFAPALEFTVTKETRAFEKGRVFTLSFQEEFDRYRDSAVDSGPYTHSVSIREIYDLVKSNIFSYLKKGERSSASSMQEAVAQERAEP